MVKRVGGCVALIVVAVGVGLTAGCRRDDGNPASESRATTRPHVVMISVDTLRADHLGCYGYARATSPQIDALAGQGVRFSNAFCQASWTLPSHMSMITSQYPHVHGVEANEHALPESATTLAEVLSAAGYQTGAIVSWVYLAEQYGFDQGFDRFKELLPPPHLVDSATTASFKAEQVTDHAIRWLERDHSRPYFLFVHYFDPHIDYAPPEPFDRMFDADYQGEANGSFDWIFQFIKGVHHEPGIIQPRDLAYVTSLYDGEIRYTDTHLGRLFAAIDRTLGMDNTLIVFTSDHGEELNDHGSMEGHQWTLYDEVVHVPLIVRLPGGGQAGRVVETPVELIDIPNTILSLLDIATPETFQGQSRSHLLSGPTPPGEPAIVYGEITRYNRKQYVRNARHKLIHTDDIGVNARGIPVKAGYELYDLFDDPAEQDNIYHPDLAVGRMLRFALDRRKESTVAGATGKPDEVRPSEAELERLRGLGYAD